MLPGNPYLLASTDRPIPVIASSAFAYQASGTANLTVSKPSGVVSGDLLVAIMWTARTGASRSWTQPGGWTEAYDSGSSSNMNMAVAYKVAGGSEPSSYTFTLSNTDRNMQGIILRVPKAAWQAGGPAAAFVLSGGDVSAPSITAARGLLIAVFTGEQANTTYSTPSGMSPFTADSDGSGFSHAVFTQEVNNGTTGTRTSGPSTGANSGILINLKPA